MAKTRFLFGFIFSLILFFGGFKYSLANQPVTLTLQSKVQKTYTQFIGVREATGQNDGVWVERFLAYTKLKKGNPWCAAFVCYTLGINGIENPKSGYSPTLFPTKNLIYKTGWKDSKQPQITDVFGIYFINKKRIAHVGFIDEWKASSNYTLTVEGNTNEAGSREGDGVYRKRRLKSQIYAISRYI